MRYQKPVLILLLACAAMGAACGGPKPNDPVTVAQVAVRANPELELVATDERQGVLTVKLKRTGQIVTVRVDDVVAGTAFRDLLAAPAAQASAAAPAASASVAPAAQPAASAPSPAMPAPAMPAPMAPAASTTSRHAAVPPKYAESGGAPMTPAAPPEASTPAAGPSAASSSGAGGSLDESKLQRRTTPANCSGNETVRLDGVLLQSDRVAVNAVGDCHVSITNSRIVGRVGVLTAGNATVTIENSTVEGTVSIQAMANSVNTVRGSTIIGRVHKMQNGEVRDLGQNTWR